MEVIIDHILNFLQFDVTRIFGKGSDCDLCCMSISTPHFSESVERCITNVYEPRPQILNGDEMMECDVEDENDDEVDDVCLDDSEVQLAAFCAELEQLDMDDELKDNQECCRRSNQMQMYQNADISESDSFLNQLKNELQCGMIDDDASIGSAIDCSCESVSKQMSSKIAEKCSSATLLELQCIEDRANELWETLNSHVRANSSCKFPNWWDLKSWQKLPFYWAALSNDILCEDPFENFKRFYMGDKKPNKRSAKRQQERVLILWHKLCPKERLPFIMEAFISKVGAGKVDIRDEHEIQRIMCELQNK
ncbi:uncharacterized protein LOC101458849 [Ceratitis capitata]|uniref:uncharacterized protein LOC101458849 n=1 Tax=Ceratitis capitata TaxID=7213 RepID=UPI00032A36AA|nr:uncharacterized protein LOC101458849 [Ceratitis capitata]